MTREWLAYTGIAGPADRLPVILDVRNYIRAPIFPGLPRLEPRQCRTHGSFDDASVLYCNLRSGVLVWSTLCITLWQQGWKEEEHVHWYASARVLLRVAA